MRTYNYLSNELPRELIEVYNDLQDDLLRIIVKKLKMGIPPQKVFQDIKDKVSGYEKKVQKIIAVIFADVKKRAVKDGDKIVKEEPVTNDEANKTIEPNLVSAFLIASALNNKIVNNAMSEYTNDYFYINGGDTKYSSKESRLNTVYKNLANNGIKIREVAKDKPKAYSIDQILRRDVMYNVNQANAEVNMENFNKSSAKFIEVSSHPTARTWNKYQKHPYENHSSWQGQVYYSGEAVDGYDEFESTCGYGEMLGICGINCYHQFQPNYTGKGTQTEYGIREIRKNYNLSQEQRLYERQIRNLKQKKVVYEEAGKDTSTLKDKISSATNQLKRFCEKNNLKYFNWRTQI